MVIKQKLQVTNFDAGLGKIQAGNLVIAKIDRGHLISSDYFSRFY